jgi:hypothetical protein
MAENSLQRESETAISEADRISLVTLILATFQRSQQQKTFFKFGFVILV